MKYLWYNINVCQVEESKRQHKETETWTKQQQNSALQS